MKKIDSAADGKEKEKESARGNDIVQDGSDPRGGIMEIGEGAEDLAAAACYYMRH